MLQETAGSNSYLFEHSVRDEYKSSRKLQDIRLADIDSDGNWDIIGLSNSGEARIFRNLYKEGFVDDPRWKRLQEYQPSGIGRPTKDIQIIDIDGDQKADYLWINPLDGSVKVWLNNYPNLPAWLEVGEVTKGAGTSVANVKYAMLRPRT
ncbi:hypothetical protein EDB80DRAFT_863899 [Ilyonectria destructans]|nr:hypothetical protein EDB80DRAFT_863899 [Ilyonectria destructans]